MIERRHFVENATKGPDVGLVVVRLVLEYFRGHVVGCSDTCSRKVLRTFHDLANSKITKDQPAVPEQEDILSLEVAVKDAIRVHVVKTECHLR